MIWCILRSKPTAGHKSCRRWCCEPLHSGLLALIPNECAKRSARKFCAISEKSWMSYTPGRNPPKVTDPPATLVPAEQIIKPPPPADDAGLEVWREYHRQMVAWIDWQHDIETWRGSVESRLEGLEEVTNLIPEILERLGPPTLTPDHQRAVQKYVQHMHELSGRPYGTVYESLKAAFGVARYADIPDQDWPRVVQWFRVQVELWRET